MTVQRFSSAMLPATPWKNHGGTTQEVACHPAGADLNHFAWRISIAHIASNGPFSVFAGIDRVITLLDGAGVQLAAPDGAVNHRLDQPLAPFVFSGDVALGCALLGGPSRGLNVMARRGVVRATVRIASGQRVQLASPSGALLAHAGSWQVEGLCSLAAGAQDGVYWAHTHAGPLRATPTSAGAQLIVVEIEEVAQRG